MYTLANILVNVNRRLQVWSYLRIWYVPATFPHPNTQTRTSNSASAEHQTLVLYAHMYVCA